MLMDGAPIVIPLGVVDAVDELLLPPIANATPAAAPAAASPSRIHLVLPEELCPGGAPEMVTAGGSVALASAAVGIGDVEARTIGSGLGFSGWVRFQT